MKQRNAVTFCRLIGLGTMTMAAAGLLLTACTPPARKPQPSVSTKKTTLTGIPACDSYLDSYLACHAAAGTYSADTLQAHYQAMRDTLLQEAGDPGVRPYLAQRCMGLARQLQDNLQDRTCMPPAVSPH